MPRSNKNLFIPSSSAALRTYAYPRKKIESDYSPYPLRPNFRRHAKSVYQKINALERTLEEQAPDDTDGYYLEFVGEPANEDRGFSLKLEALEPSKGFHIVSYSVLPNGAEKAIIFVPEGKIDVLKRKIQKSFSPDKPGNIDFVSSISDVKKALLSSLWTSDPELYPQNELQKFTWEVWIFNDDITKEKFNSFCEAYNIQQAEGALSFIDREVRIIRCSPKRLSNIFQYNKILCEIRKPADTALPIYDSTREEQLDWADEILDNLEIVESNCELWVLDAGVSRVNPLLNHIDPRKIQTIDTAWPVFDDQRWGFHGSLMAGVCIYGNLLQQLLSNQPVQLNHSLGSVRILPPNGVPNNLVKNYPFITQQAVALAEIESPEKDKIYCMAVTDPITCEKGEATSWSASLDQLAVGDQDENKKLFIVSAGNVDHTSYPRNYPVENETSNIQDPAQAWNVLSVGAYTDLDVIQETHLVGAFLPLATRGGLSPRSTTSLQWTSYSFVPIKPDIVFEGGNVAHDPLGTGWDEPASLSVLSTSGKANKVFDYFNGTSSATAYTANMAARICAAYPEYWPETIRALIVHSAEWTSEMKSDFRGATGKDKIHALLRKYGYGVPSLDRALACAANEVTLIWQSTFNPYKMNQSDRVVFNEFELIEIPWPVEVLRALGNTRVRMKVTISYFIEPNPSRRGEVGKYQYASHGLRFKMIGPTESERSFLARVSETFREQGLVRGSEDTGNWVIGPDLRTRGSIHSDTWNGKATDLANKNKIAIYPVGGWWKDYVSKERWDSDARYSLVVSIEGPSTATEIYSEVENNIEIVIENLADVEL